MFSIGSDGSISRDDSRFASLVDASVPNVRDFQDLQPQARVAASLLASTTRYAYKIQFSKLHKQCQANRRISMPLDEETICIYFSMLAVKSLSPHLILATRSAIRLFQRLSFPTLEPATDSPRVQALIIGIKKKFGKTKNADQL